jgi:YesN/AraC family two-component response regulator
VSLKNNIWVCFQNVAGRLGFYDEFYFSHIFKKHIGMSPREHRNDRIAGKRKGT